MHFSDETQERKINDAGSKNLWIQRDAGNDSIQ